MFLSKFDWLSFPPTLYFLQKRTNKNAFGGILFIIYNIIMICITTIYMLNFFINDKYDIRYSLYKNYTDNIEKNNKNENLNPHLNFTFDIKRISQNLEVQKNDSEFMIFDFNNFNIREKTIISNTPSYMNFYIAYPCSNRSTLEEYAKSNDNDIVYILNMTYSGYKIDHQSEDSPLERNRDKYIFYKEFYFTFNKTTIFNVNWEVITYKEERGIFGLFDKLTDKKYEFSGIDISYIEHFYTEKNIELDRSPLKYIVLAVINMRNIHDQNIEYKRIKRSLLDVLANIGALYSTFFSVFSFVFRYYSRNFDNFKIIKEILSNQKILKKKNIKIFKSITKKFENIPFNKNIFETDDIPSIETKRSVPVKSKSKEINISKTGMIKIDENDENDEYFNLININFIHFILNNIYCKIKERRKEQETIEICNKIIAKYISIDAILYNQILLENFFDDYTWNDIRLKEIENNIFFLKLKLIK